MRLFKVLIILTCSLTLFSCGANQRIIVDKDYKKVRRVVKIKAKHHFLAYGIGQSKVINAQDYCDEVGLSVGAVDFRNNYWLQSFTAGIYSPRAMKVYCFDKSKVRKRKTKKRRNR